MAVTDSSALIPLSWIGHLDLITVVFDTVRTTEAVRKEVLTEGKRGTAALQTVLEGAYVQDMPSNAEEVAQLEGVAVTDPSVILVAANNDEVLLADDKALIEVARSHGVACWWVTTLLPKCTKEAVVSADEATDILYDLVEEGMNLHPKVYTQVQKKLRDLGKSDGGSS